MNSVPGSLYSPMQNAVSNQTVQMVQLIDTELDHTSLSQLLLSFQGTTKAIILFFSLKKKVIIIREPMDFCI